MNLNLVLDYQLKELVKPGYRRNLTSRELAETGTPASSDASKQIWRDEATKTIMLRPRQLDSDFINTENQINDGVGSSVIRLAELEVYATNLTDASIYEAPVGNNANPYIWHVPAGPSSFFPAAVNPFPAAAPSLTSIPVPYDAMPSIVASPSMFTDIVYEVPTTMPDFGSEPAPVVAGNTSDGKWLFHSSARLPANQGLFFRWHHPDPKAGYPLTYIFMVGQYCLRIKDVICEIFRDTSDHGDRSAWQLVQKAPLWNVNDLRIGVGAQMMAVPTAMENTAHDRSLMWLPYRRNQVYLQSNLGQWALLTTRPDAIRNADDSDWDITREDNLAIWVMTPSPGRLQVQRLAYTTLHVHVRTPHFTIPYPAVFTEQPDVTLTGDSDNGTTLGSTLSEPPDYTIPVNDEDHCIGADKTSNSADRTRTFGIDVGLQGDGRHTPFLYALALTEDRTFQTRGTTPFTIPSTNDTSYFLQEASLSLGANPGEGRMTAKVVDNTPYTLGDYYYRSYMPVVLNDDSTPLFVGWSEPNEVQPLKVISGTPRMFTFSAVDRWKQLADTYLLDQESWEGIGHITAVTKVMEQAGVDCTSIETPPINTTRLDAYWNTKLGLADRTVKEHTKMVKNGWKPQDRDTAATFIKRIADLFSGWDVGFRSNGTPFYLPRDYFTTPTATFAAAHTGSAPYYREVTFRTVEPEANVIQVQAGSKKDGSLIRSSVWVDWASILNKNVVNYLGRWRAEYVPIGGTYTCNEVNWIARKIFEQTRRRHRIAEFEGDYVQGLEVGHVVTLGSYGNYRLQSIQAQFTHGSWSPTRYAAEFIESGVGLA